MKAEDLRTKTVDELGKLLLDTRKEQFNLRFQRSQGALENTAKIRSSRRDIARVKTFLNAQKAGAATAPAKAAPTSKKAPVKAEAKKPAAKKTTTKKAAPKKAAAKKQA